MKFHEEKARAFNMKMVMAVMVVKVAKTSCSWGMTSDSGLGAATGGRCGRRAGFAWPPTLTTQ